MKFIYNYVDLWIVTKNNIFMEQLAGFDIIKNALIKTRPTISTIVKEIYCIIMIRKRNPRSKLCCRI